MRRKGGGEGGGGEEERGGEEEGGGGGGEGGGGEEEEEEGEGGGEEEEEEKEEDIYPFIHFPPYSHLKHRALSLVPPPAWALRMTVAMQTRSIPETLHCHAERGQGRLATTLTSLGVQVYGYVSVYRDLIYSFLGFFKGALLIFYIFLFQEPEMRKVFGQREQ